MKRISKEKTLTLEKEDLVLLIEAVQVAIDKETNLFVNGTNTNGHLNRALKLTALKTVLEM